MPEQRPLPAHARQRILLVAQRAAHLPGAVAHHRGKGRIGGEVCAQRHRVQRKADQVGGLCAGAARGRRADQEVVFAAGSMQHGLEQRQHHHEDACLEPRCQFAQACGLLRREMEFEFGAAVARFHVQRAGHRRRRGRVFEHALPVRAQRGATRPCQQLPLAHQPVAVAAGLRRHRRCAGAQRVVGGEDLVADQFETEVVAGDMVHARTHPHAVGTARLARNQKAETADLSRIGIERLVGLALEPGAQAGFIEAVGARQRHLGGETRGACHHDLAVFLDKAAMQRIMAVHHVAHRLLEQFEAQASRHLDREHHVVGGAMRMAAVEGQQRELAGAGGIAVEVAGMRGQPGVGLGGAGGQQLGRGLLRIGAGRAVAGHAPAAVLQAQAHAFGAQGSHQGASFGRQGSFGRRHGENVGDDRSPPCRRNLPGKE
ncbi:hypothetical protein D9M72_428880 [compost metagenome]